MKVSIFYFSGTGNTLYAVKKFTQYLEKNFETKTLSIEEKIDDNEFYDTDIIFLAYPIYLSDMPRNMKKFIERMPEQNKSIGTICTQAVFSGDGAYVSHNILEQKGYSHTWSVQLKAFTNIGLMGLKPPQDYNNNQEVLLKMDEDLKNLANDVYERKTTLQDKGLFKYILGMTQRPFYNMSMKSISNKLWVDDGICTKCGVCVDICPVEAIKLDESIEFIKRQECLGCLRCQNFCPSNAISRSKKGNTLQYKGPTKEIFSSIVKGND